MKKRLLPTIILFLFFSIGCASTKVAKQQEEPDNASSAEAKVAADNETASMTGDQTAAAAAEKNETEPEAEKESVPPKETAAAADTVAERRVKARKMPAPLIPEINTGERISLNFDNADIYEVINALSDFLGISYIIDPAVKGRVNIHTSGEIDKSQLLPILETIFDMNNIALVEFGNIYKIVPVTQAKKEIIDLSMGRQLEEIQSYDRIIIQIIPLRYVSSSDVSKLLKPFVSKGGDIIDYKKGNILIVVDTAASIKKLLKLVDIVDADAFEHTKIRFFKIENAEVKDIAKELQDIFSSFGIPKTTAKGIGLHFIPIERISFVLAVSQIPGIFEKVEHWLGILDTVDIEAEEQVFIYFVENGKADEIGDVLKKLYSDGKTRKTVRRQPAKKKGKTPSKRAATASSVIQGEIKFVTDETTNSIIVRATPHDYAIIKETMLKLDIIPKQVLIEVLIAEVTLSGDTEFGIEWSLLGDRAEIGGYKGQDAGEISFGLGGLGTDLTKSLGRGFSYRFNSNRLQAFLVAQASKNKLNILSSPHILAADNKVARIEVGQEVPIVTGEYVPMGVEAATSTSRNIEYRSTGVILQVTPRINSKGLVAMEITQEVSEAQPVVAGGIQSPIISNRKAETSLVVQHGQTIVIGGLITEKTSKNISGVPILSSIPLLSYFFSDTRESKEKIELIIMITPYVINTIDEADLVSAEFKEKLWQVRKLIDKSADYWKGYR